MAWNLKEAGGKVPAWRRETAYKAYASWMSLHDKTKFEIETKKYQESCQK